MMSIEGDIGDPAGSLRIDALSCIVGAVVVERYQKN